MFLTAPKNSRYEIKFVAYEHHYFTLINWIKLHELNFKREYKSRIVNNIYFDSFCYDSYKSNIFGDSSRIKMRYRWYGSINQKTKGNLEFKYKRNLYGWKKKYKIPELDLIGTSDWKKLCNLMHINLPNQYKDYFLVNSHPQIINQYYRDYFKSFNNKIRITIDRNHYVFDQRYTQYPNLDKKTLTQRIIVMELKFDRNFRDSLDELIKNVPIRSSRNSKYVNSIRAVTGI